MPDKKSFLLRIAPEIHDALAGWAAEELRSMNGQVEFLLRQALAGAGRLPKHNRGEQPGMRNHTCALTISAGSTAFKAESPATTTKA